MRFVLVAGYLAIDLACVLTLTSLILLLWPSLPYGYVFGSSFIVLFFVQDAHYKADEKIRREQEQNTRQ